LPTALLLIAANLLPLAGVVFWGWDAFELLMLYWMETAVIAFWTILRVATPLSSAATGAGGAPRIGGAIGTALFFTVHAGIFMAVHFVFLWTLFAGPWAERIHTPADFFRVLVIGEGLWLPLGVLFLVRGAQDLWDRLARRLAGDAAPPPTTGQLLTGLYARIVVMQLTILASGAFAIFTGSIVALILLIALKTLVDLGFDRFAGGAGRTAAAAGETGGG
jgi:hypothetical protein